VTHGLPPLHMTWQQTADRTLKTAIQAFKTPGVYTRAAAPGSPISLDGVFSKKSQMVNPETGVSVDSNRPSYGIRRADLPADPLPADTILVSGITYRIIEVNEDGEGGVELILNTVG
jgi:hypothetical protein